MLARRQIWLVTIFLAASAARGSLWAGSEARPDSSEDLEAQLLADAADGRLDEFTLCEAALIAGGIEHRDGLIRHLHQFKALCDVAQTQASPADPPRERAAALLACLHRELLRGPYRAEDWRIEETLENGHYNCLTATILYMSLCRRFELPISAVSSPGHVSCCLEGESPLVIETTCARWFELAAAAREQKGHVIRGRESFSAHAFSDDKLFGRKRLADPDATARAISDVELLAKVYYNRGLARLAENDYAPAVDCLRISRRLDPLDGAALENELAALNNWALCLAEAGRFEEASRRICQGLALDSGSARLLDNDLHIHAQWVRALCDEGRYAEALDVLQEGYRRRPDAPLFDHPRAAVMRHLTGPAS